MSEKIYVGADHAGFQLKQKLVDELKRLGYEPVDAGPKAMDPAAVEALLQLRRGDRVSVIPTA